MITMADIKDQSLRYAEARCTRRAAAEALRKLEVEHTKRQKVTATLESQVAERENLGAHAMAPECAKYGQAIAQERMIAKQLADAREAEQKAKREEQEALELLVGCYESLPAS